MVTIIDYLVVTFIVVQVVAVVVTGLAVPKSELVNRRKSPALWREDILVVDYDGVSSSSSSSTSDHRPRGFLKRPPEVMAPVGGWPQLYAAIGNGADSIYVGMKAFSARARATNFDAYDDGPDGLRHAVQVCHEANVKVYVALNTLVFGHELAEVEDLIRQCAMIGVDALIVQDLGVMKIAQHIISDLTISDNVDTNGLPTPKRMQVHASTQQTVTSSDGAAFSDDLGCSRIVLGRELSIDEIRTVADEVPDVELEAFVHGALCVSYSGQCFSSEFSGGRSANRGQCAQACRLPYGLIRDGELIDLQDFSYLLSPQDLCGIDHVPQLLDANIHCLKIEGRLKDAAYVSATTRAYRDAVDKAWEDYCAKNNIENRISRKVLSNPNEVVTRSDLAQVFSRGQDERHDGLTAGFFDGSKHQTLVRGRSPRHRGIHVGRVIEDCNSKSGLVIRLDNEVELKLGDGLVVDRGQAQEEELGGAIFDIQTNNDNTSTIYFSRDVQRKWKKCDDNVRKGLQGATGILAPANAHVWKTSDAAVEKKMKRLSSSEVPRPEVAVRVEGRLGSPLTIRIANGLGQEGIGASQGDLEHAENFGLSDQSIVKAIGTLGNTDWALDPINIDTSGLQEGLWCPMSWIKEARRAAVDDLIEKSKVQDWMPTQLFKNNDIIDDLMIDLPDSVPTMQRLNRPRLSVLARNIDQVDILCRMAEDGGPVDEIIVDFLEVDGMEEAVSRTRKAGVYTVVASPRIIKPNESGIWRTLLRLEPDALLVRGTGLLRRMMTLGGPGTEIDLNGKTVTVPQLIGDFSLNVANPITAWELLSYGCSRVTASYDLGANAITDLLRGLGPEHAQALEVVLHAHLPIFHTEHCVFARFLSNGDSYVDCGHPCTRHSVHLRDQNGDDNLVLADMGCRNTVFAAQAQSGAHSAAEWIDAGVRYFRIELVDESSQDVGRMVDGYRKVLDGELKPSELWEILESIRDGNGRKAGVSFGSFRNGVERRAGEITI